jgi:uncharacterized protein (TIGR00290 family)
MSWSGGKDSALALARLLHNPAIRILGILTTVTAGYDRISIHGVRRALLERQAKCLGLPLREIVIEPGCTNDSDEAAWLAAFGDLPDSMREAQRVAFGDIFLEDVREYRERLMGRLGFDCVFPLWGEPTNLLSRATIAAGIKARIVCVDTKVLSPHFAGVLYDADLLCNLPDEIDPCGERGEFHTFVSDGPGFRVPVSYSVGEVVLREGRFAYCDLIPEEAPEATVTGYNLTETQTG